MPTVLGRWSDVVFVEVWKVEDSLDPVYKATLSWGDDDPAGPTWRTRVGPVDQVTFNTGRSQPVDSGHHRWQNLAGARVRLLGQPGPRLYLEVGDPADAPPAEHEMGLGDGVEQSDE